jgi:hypothetical protein
MSFTTSNNSDDAIIRGLITKILNGIHAKDVPTLQSVAHPQGAAVSMMNGSITEKNLHAHMASLSEFPGELNETITDGSLDVRVFGGYIAVATFHTEITMDGKLMMTGHNVVTFHKSKIGDGPEEWKLTVISDGLSTVSSS